MIHTIYRNGKLDSQSTSTVPLKSKLTLETQTSRLDPRASMLEMFEDHYIICKLRLINT